MKSRGKTRAFPLSYTAMKTERDQDKAFSDLIRDTYRSFDTAKFKSEDIKLDAALEQEKKEVAAKAAAPIASEKPGVASGKTAGDVGDGTADDDDESDDDISAEITPEFDVQRRESLRILADWFRLLAPQKLADAK
jgi:FlaG/FlaF family flagellin (archaellin)